MPSSIHRTFYNLTAPGLSAIPQLTVIASMFFGSLGQGSEKRMLNDLGYSEKTALNVTVSAIGATAGSAIQDETYSN